MIFHILPVCVTMFTVLNIGTVSSAHLDGRIINGTKSYETWVAELIVLQNGTKNHQCGGTLIHPQWVLTAAHCLYDLPSGLIYPFEDIKVSLGSSKSTEGKLFTIQNMFEHDYRTSDNGLDNDIALIKLTEEVPSKITNPAHLPTTNDNFENQIATAFGWGVTNNGQYSPDLLQGKIYVSGQKECKSLAANYHYEKKICTLAEKTSSIACSGDSGGPLAIRNENNQYVVIGLTAYGDCRDSTTYTRVSYYLNWILSYVKS